MSSLIRLGIALLIILLGLVSYFSNTVDNPITGERQRVQLTAQQEITLGLQARQQVEAEYGGLHPNKGLQYYIQQVGTGVVQKSAAAKSPYHYQFSLLQNSRIINAFALPGGQVLITAALLEQLASEAQLAGVLGHEIGHIVARHGAEHLAKQPFNQSLMATVSDTASDRRDSSSQSTALGQAVTELVDLHYGRDDELESDKLSFRFMTEAGYDPEGVVELMRILDSARQGGQPPQFFSTHPSPDNRVKRLEELIAKTYPKGVPSRLKAGRKEFTEAVKFRLEAAR